MFATSSFCQLLHPLFFISGQRKWNIWCIVVRGKHKGRLLYRCGVGLSRARSERGGWVGLSSAWLISVALLFPARQVGGPSYSFSSAQRDTLLTSQTRDVHLLAPLLNWHPPPPPSRRNVRDLFLKTCHQQSCAFSRDYLAIELSCGAVTFCEWKRLLVQSADVEGIRIHPK